MIQQRSTSSNHAIFICLLFWFVDVMVDIESGFGFKANLISKDLSI